MATYDLTPRIAPNLDRHLVFPLLEFLQELKAYPDEQILKNKIDLLNKTNMVDYAMDIHKSLYRTEDVPQDMVERRAEVVSRLKALEEAAAPLVNFLQNANSVQELRADKQFNLQMLTERYQIGPDQIEALYQYAKFQFECGNYSGAADYLYQYRALCTNSERSLTALWGKLAAEILMQNWDIALEELNRLKEIIDSKNFSSPLNQVQNRIWLMHWSLFIFFNHDNGRTQLIDLFNQDKYLNAIQTNAPHLLRYLATAFIVNKRRRPQFKDFIKVIQQEQHSYKDPITEFLACVYVTYDFDGAQKKMRECEEVILNDPFLGKRVEEGSFSSVPLREEFLENARLFIFETYCRIHQRIDMGVLAEKLNLNYEEAERWIVNLMAGDEENPASTSRAEDSDAMIDDLAELAAMDSSPLPSVQPSIPPVVPTPVVPPIAPIPTIPLPPVLRPLAPLPVLPPVFRPPVSQNGEVRRSDSDSDDDDMDPSHNTGSTAEYEISKESKLVRERREKAIQELLMKRRASALAVPTNDMAVRARLRRLGEPITLFGEREMERRDRLRMIMAKLDADGQLEKLLKAHEEEEAAAPNIVEDAEDQITQYPFYTEGSKALLDARIEIANYSLPRAAMRLQRARRKKDDPDEDLDAEMDWELQQAGSFILDCSEIGDDRPLSGCSFSHDGQMLATCSLSGVAKLWSMPQVNKVATLKGHTERATDVAFSPACDQVATASADRTAKLWNTDGSLLMTFEGHLDRLARIAFHPSGKYLGTTSFDKTWRLWDVETGEELLLQEGHSRSIYGISFHHDGSLAASCGLDALARVWDLRIGRSLMALEGHVKPVLAVSFSPNGYHMATGGEDNTCRIWDLRKKKSLYTIPAHSNLISQVHFESQEGYFLVTGSYDMTAKVWSARDFKPVKTLSGHESKVTSLDVLGDGHCIATVSNDRTIKLWSSSSSVNEKDLF